MKVSIVLMILVTFALAGGFLAYGQHTVTLVAKPWNQGHVHLWSDLSEGSDATFVDIATGTRCARPKNELYSLGRGEMAIYYFQVDCNGVVGYVERDQVR